MHARSHRRMQHAHGLTGRQIPEADRFVQAHRNQLVAIGGRHQLVNGVGVAAGIERQQRFGAARWIDLAGHMRLRRRWLGQRRYQAKGDNKYPAARLATDSRWQAQSMRWLVEGEADLDRQQKAIDKFRPTANDYARGGSPGSSRVGMLSPI